MDKEIIIKPNFVFKDYFKANLFLALNKPYYYIMLPTILFFLCFDLFYISQGSKKIIELLYFPDVVFILLPLIILLSVYKLTKTRLSNVKLKENIFIKFNTEYLEDVGDSFNMKYFWKDIFKILEKKEWFLIYIDKKCAKVIRKADLNDNQYNELKELFDSLNIKKSLK
ncbi:hypothetical protein GENT5_00860 [Flavobacterium ammoniigenes]|jgi:hypothetical protein|uniref:YcxB-like C-terminal domain-containing protein n=1 Tax=Flavobacterium ammoniigenes TaxID=1751095 RepID=A0ABN6KX39_9FLAO|nr:YcxB family protein [Flavobacterium ammoniigenes]BDB53781.1 hypothetical protein GENT5_00860 [Flavobacterium ammoniigenes]